MQTWHVRREPYLPVFSRLAPIDTGTTNDFIAHQQSPNMALQWMLLHPMSSFMLVSYTLSLCSSVLSSVTASITALPVAAHHWNARVSFRFVNAFDYTIGIGMTDSDGSNDVYETADDFLESGEEVRTRYVFDNEFTGTGYIWARIPCPSAKSNSCAIGACAHQS
jgi:hypothetical protein